MYCPSCGKMIAAGSAFCMHCGKPTGVSMQASSIAVTPVSTTNTPVCPNCRQMDEARRVMGMVAQGVTLSQNSTTSSGVGVGLAGAAGTGGQALGAGVQSWSSVSQSQGIAVTALAALLVAPIEGISPYNRSLMPIDPSQGKTSSSAHWTMEYARWSAELRFRNYLVLTAFDNSRLEKLYYCSRCAVVYVPGEGDFAQLNAVGAYFYRYPPVANEFCEIESHAWPSSYALFAMAYGPKGVRCIQEVNWKENLWTAPGELDPMGHTVPIPKPNSKKARSNYESLVADLQATGWVKLSVSGPNWWQARFSR